MLITDSTKITQTGQVTIPIAIRRLLKTDTVAFEVMDNKEIRLIAITDAGGTLKEFSKEKSEDFQALRNKAWKAQTRRLTKKP
jgi:bifunctional DNA-binding transcriptional regulator/antitoxin component of YhaV-PrlF toxin-antitoxin module